jgi:hypothetical protein
MHVQTAAVFAKHSRLDRALIVANEFLESEVSELMKAVSHGYVRGIFHTYTG